MRSLAVKNLMRRPARTAALILLSGLLSLVILGGTLLISGLRSGLNSLHERLGADIMVVPYEATTKQKLDDMILQGNPGYFYMDDAVMEKLEGIDGIGEMSAQFFLASTSSSCCSYKVQIIGFDPETDFTIEPWVQLSYKEELGDMEVFVGSTLNAFAGETLQFYGTPVRVAARLDHTGTYLDTAVYANEKTIKTLIDNAKAMQIYDFGGVDPYNIVSCVLINTADGYSVDEVLNDINIHIRKVEAIRTQSMISDITAKLDGISDIAGGLVLIIWILVLIIMFLAFGMVAQERKKEFAVLRVLGASRKELGAVVMQESLIQGLAGSLIGALLSILMVYMFSGFIESALNLPFLLPEGKGLIGLTVFGILLSVATGAAASAVSAWRISRLDAALILREDN